MHPSLLEMALLLSLQNTGRPLTGGSCNKSPTNTTFNDPNQPLPPNSSSSRK